MELLSKTTLIASAIMFSSSVYAKDNYFSSTLGIGTQDLKYDKLTDFNQEKLSKSIRPISLSLAFGSYFNEHFRGEIAGSVLYGKTQGLLSNKEKNSKNDFDVSFVSYGATANLYLDIPASKSFVPYITGGIGVAHNTAKIKENGSGGSKLKEKTKGDKSKNKYNFVWQVGAGFNIPLNDKTKLNFGYKYQQIGLDQKFEYKSAQGQSGALSNANTNKEPLNVKAKGAHIAQIGLQFDF